MRVNFYQNMPISLQGVSPADYSHYGRCFWELSSNSMVIGDFGKVQLSTAPSYGGREQFLWLNEDFYKAKLAGKAYIRGEKAWGKKGLLSV